MADEILAVFEGNTLNTKCTVSGLGNLSGYTGTLTVYETVSGSTAIFEKTGSNNGLEILFTVDATDNDIDIGSYLYEVTIDNGTKKYTLSQGKYHIKESAKF